MDKAITALRKAVKLTTHAIDYIQPAAKDREGWTAKLDLLGPRRHLLCQLAKAEVVEHDYFLATDGWEERQKEIVDVNERIRVIHELLDLTTTQENAQP